jgi:ADP-ribosylglycohydrolase
MDKRLGCLFGLFAGDAFAMPVHMYQDLHQMRLDPYVAPKQTFKNSRMDPVSITSQDNESPTVIYFHYRNNLQAGENTLEAQLVRVLLRCLGESPPDMSSEGASAFADTFFGKVCCFHDHTRNS